MTLRGNGPDPLFRRHRDWDWHIGAGKPVRFMAAEAGLLWIEQTVRIRWSLEVHCLGNVGPKETSGYPGWVAALTPVPPETGNVGVEIVRRFELATGRTLSL